jgi:hypothetical protein
MPVLVAVRFLKASLVSGFLANSILAPVLHHVHVILTHGMRWHSKLKVDTSNAAVHADTVPRTFCDELGLSTRNVSSCQHQALLFSSFDFRRVSCSCPLRELQLRARPSKIANRHENDK